MNKTQIQPGSLWSLFVEHTKGIFFFFKHDCTASRWTRWVVRNTAEMMHITVADLLAHSSYLILNIYMKSISLGKRGKNAARVLRNLQLQYFTFFDSLWIEGKYSHGIMTEISGTPEIGVYGFIK